MWVHSDNIRAMYKHKNRSLTYFNINIANLSRHHLEVNGRDERAGCFTLFAFLVFMTVIVLWLFLKVTWVAIPCVIEVIPDHTHLLLTFVCVDKMVFGYGSCNIKLQHKA